MTHKKPNSMAPETDAAAVTTGTILGAAGGAILGLADSAAGMVGGSALGGAAGALLGRALDDSGLAPNVGLSDSVDLKDRPEQNSESFDVYSDGHEAGVFGYKAFGSQGISFDEAEPEMIRYFESISPSLTWQECRSAAMSAWNGLADPTWDENAEHDTLSPVCNEGAGRKAKAT